MSIRHWLQKPGYPYFPYNYRHRAIFIHIPKCGGTSVLAELSGETRIPRYHADWRTYRQADPVAFKNFFKFAVVRDPTTRLYSAYNYLLDGGNHKDDLGVSKAIKARADNFDEFVHNFLNTERIHEHIILRPQYLFLFDFGDQCQIDQIIRFEDFSEAMLQLLHGLGLKPASIAHANQSATPATVPSTETSERISLLYKRDYELLGYQQVAGR